MKILIQRCCSYKVKFFRHKTLNQCTICYKLCDGAPGISQIHDSCSGVEIYNTNDCDCYETRDRQIMITLQDAPTIINVVNQTRTFRTITRARVTADWCSMSIPYSYWFCAIR